MSNNFISNASLAISTGFKNINAIVYKINLRNNRISKF